LGTEISNAVELKIDWLQVVQFHAELLRNAAR
jgi:hypothetical protein